MRGAGFLSLFLATFGLILVVLGGVLAVMFGVGFVFAWVVPPAWHNAAFVAGVIVGACVGLAAMIAWEGRHR